MNNNHSRVSLKERQEDQKKQFEEQLLSIRKTIKEVLQSKAGQDFFRLLFLMSGGDYTEKRFTQLGEIDTLQTLLAYERKAFYNELRAHMSSDDIKIVERHSWEENKPE